MCVFISVYVFGRSLCLCLCPCLCPSQCLCPCLCPCICVCAHVCASIFVAVSMPVSMPVSMCVSMFVSMFVSMSVRACVCAYVCVCEERVRLDVSTLLAKHIQQSAAGESVIVDSSGKVLVSVRQAQQTVRPQAIELPTTPPWKGEVYIFDAPLMVSDESTFSVWISIPWVLQFLYGEYNSAKVCKTVRHWRELLQRFGLPAAHLKNSRHSKIHTCSRQQLHVDVDTRVSSSHEYTITLPGHRRFKIFT